MLIHQQRSSLQKLGPIFRSRTVGFPFVVFLLRHEPFDASNTVSALRLGDRPVTSRRGERAFREPGKYAILDKSTSHSAFRRTYQAVLLGKRLREVESRSRDASKYLDRNHNRSRCLGRFAQTYSFSSVNVFVESKKVRKSNHHSHTPVCSTVVSVPNCWGTN